MSYVADGECGRRGRMNAGPRTSAKVRTTGFALEGPLRTCSAELRARRQDFERSQDPHLVIPPFATIKLSLDKFVIILQFHLVDQRSYSNVSIQHESCSSHNSSCRLSGNNSTRAIVFFFHSNWRRRCLYSCIKILSSNQTIRSTSSRVVLHQTFFFPFLRSVPPSRNA